MSEMARAARAAMKAKASRLSSGEPKAKVDASTWTPPEMMNTGMKTGMRPLTRRAFKKGGKVIEKCEGGKAMKRADRKARKDGGRSLVTDLINRNDKKANKAREGGDAHVGGYAKGGDVAQDKKLIKKAIRQHDKNMHGGKSEEIKLKKGGRTGKQEGGKAIPGDAPTRGYTPNSQATGETYKDVGDLIEKKGLAPKEKAKGGGTYFGGTRPTGGRMPKADGGKSDSRYWTEGGTRSTDPTVGATPSLKDAIAAKAVHPKTSEDDWAQMSPGMKREILRSMQRKGRKSGGRAKGKTNIIISINPQRGDQQQPQQMMPKMPTPPPMAAPPVAPPAMGPGAPPPMPPMAPPPPGLAGGAPGGMPPKPFKRGGRAYRSYKDMDAGALSGMGRLEKTEIEHHKRVGRLSGGRARSYKDMDAGALSGMGRIEKTAIQKHKR